MILIIEGPNGAGKSTLAMALVEDGPTQYIHNSASRTPLTDYTNQGQWALQYQAKGVSTIIDRFNVGEQVYPAIYGRERLIEPLEDHILVQALGTLGARWLLLCPPVHRLVLSHRTRGEDYDEAILAAERDGFIAYFNQLPPQLKPFFSLVPDDATLAQNVSAVRKLVNSK